MNDYYCKSLFVIIVSNNKKIMKMLNYISPKRLFSIVLIGSSLLVIIFLYQKYFNSGRCYSPCDQHSLLNPFGFNPPSICASFCGPIKMPTIFYLIADFTIITTCFFIFHISRPFLSKYKMIKFFIDILIIFFVLYLGVAFVMKDKNYSWCALSFGMLGKDTTCIKYSGAPDFFNPHGKCEEYSTKNVCTGGIFNPN
jgi:hypothetical protein